MSFIEDIEALVAANATGLLGTAPSWTRKPLGTVAQVINGFAFQSKHFSNDVSSCGIPLVRIRDVVEGRSETFYSGSVPNGYWVEDGDVLVGMDGDFNLASWNSGRALLNQRVCKIVCDERKIRKRYLAYVLPGYLKLINEHTSSVTVKHLSSRTLQQLPIPVPSTSIQDRLVAHIDKLFAEIDEGERALADARAGLNTYRKSLLNAAVTGRITANWRTANRSKESGSHLLVRILTERRKFWANSSKRAAKDYVEPTGPIEENLPELPDEWCWASIDQLCGHVTSGSRAWARYYDQGSCIFVMAQNVRAGLFDATFRQRVDPPKDDPERKRTQVNKGDLLLTIVGANTGDLCRVDFNPTDHYVCQSVALLRPRDEAAGEMMELFFTSEIGRRLQMEGMIYGAGRPHLNFDQIKSLAVPIPPEKEIGQIKLELRRALKIAPSGTDLEKINSDDLRQSILAAAFRGDLVS